jgi:DNA helicase-2/ATP-dependent DNA helicase PcrA
MHNARFKELTTSQQKAVFHVEGPLLVLAGPGSGKTRVITYRVAALIEAGIRPYNICAITFTNKAAEEMRQRVFDLRTAAGAHISTFHSLCVRILRRYSDQAEIGSNFSIYNESEQNQCMKKAIKECELDTKNFPPARMREAVSTLKNNLLEPELFNKQAEDFFSKTLARVYLRYQEVLTGNNALDFDDLLFKTARLLRDYLDVRNELSNRFRYLLIDEYQDTNHAQYQIAKALVAAHNNICATGDPDQSIYRWRGADIRNIMAFETDWPDATVVKLEENFRSTPNILAVADNLIAANQNRKQKKLLPTRPPGKDVVINPFEDERAESDAIAAQIRQLIDAGAPPNEIAVFYRVNSMSRPLEEALITGKIPYQIIRGVEFYNRKEIRDITAYLKVLVNADDETALLRIINTPIRGIGKTTIDRVLTYATENNISFYSALKRSGSINTIGNPAKAKIAVFINMLEQFKAKLSDSVPDLIERIFSESGLENSLTATDIKDQASLENVRELINAAAIYSSQAEEPSLLDYLQQIALFSDTDTYDPAKRGICLMTLHAAKGLEFDNVFIVGVEEAILPHERSSSDADETEEERRLFFVGITRAKTNLQISYTRYRTNYGQLLRTIPSQFLFELGLEFAQPADNLDLREELDYSDGQLPDLAIGSKRFRKGQLVRHDLFGMGTVEKFIDVGEESVIVVKFNSGRTKRLMLKYANLSKI